MVHHAGVKHRWSAACARAAIALAAATTLLSPAPAAAAPDESSPQTQYRQAHEAIAAKDWEEARRLLLDLWARAHTYDVGSSLVFVEYQLQHYARAATFAAFAIQNAPPIERPEEIDRLRKALAELKERVGTVTVVVNRPGADVLVDAEIVGTSPLASELYVDVGPHQIEARFPGGVPASERIDALAGEEYRVTLDLPPSAGETAAAAPAAAPVESAPPTAQPRPNYTPAIVAASVGGAALIGGVVSIIVSVNKREDARNSLAELSGVNQCGPGSDPARADRCRRIAELADDSDTFRALGFIGFGAALAAGAVTYVLWPSSSSERVSATVVPAVSSTGGGFLATVSGAF
jgi:hypothetical protein